MRDVPERNLTVVAQEVHARGGMERAIMETIAGLLEMGWRVTLVACVCELGSHPLLRWIRVPTPRRPFVVAFPLFALIAGGVVASTRHRRGTVMSLGAIIPTRVDVVVVQFCHAAFGRRGIYQQTRNTPIYRLHGRVSHIFALGLERWCYRHERVGRMIAVSGLVKQELQTYYCLGQVPIEVIPNGVDLDRFRPNQDIRASERDRLGITSEELVALFVGGDWKRKGLEIAIEASARAGWTLVVAGTGDTVAWGRYAHELGAKVMFCGHVRNPERVYCAADAFVLPSQYEGFALVTIEAAASGLPLLVTKATGAAELAGRAGSTPVSRDTDAYTAELKRLGDDPEMRRELGEKARRAVQELSWPRIAAAYASICEVAT